MVQLPYRDRVEAGRALIGPVRRAIGDARDVLVLALPRGGVPVGYELARGLEADLDVMVVRKLGHPDQPELAIGAIAMGGVRVMNTRLSAGVATARIEEVYEREKQELDRRDEKFRGRRPPPKIEGRTVVVVDDGLATGATMRAALQALSAQKPARLLAAVPVAPADAVDRLEAELICPATPTMFAAIGQFYDDFSQTSDEEVRRLLREAWGET